MKWIRVSTSLLMLTTVMGLASLAAFQETTKGKDEKKGSDNPTLVTRPVLPANFKKVGLRDEQTKKIYKILGEYNTKIAELESQIKKLRGERDEACENVLSAEQRKILDEIRLKKKTDK